MLKFSCLLLAVAAAMPFGCPPTTDPVVPAPLDVTIAPVSLASPGQKVSLVATVTNNPSDGGALTYAWYQTAGQGVAISSADQATAEFAAPSLPARQTLTFAVTVRNAAGAVGQAEVSLEVRADVNYSPYDPNINPNFPVSPTGPTADAGSNERVDQNAAATLDGSSSRGQRLTYAWRQVSGRSVSIVDPSAPETSFTAPAYVENGDNVLRFELVVTDRNGRTATDRVEFTIRNPNVSDRLVRVETTLGNFTIELFPDEAPKTVENFLQYVDDEFYDGTIFHRVVVDFVIQGGGFTPDLVQKETRAPIVNESTNGLKNDRGTVAMARTNDPNSATSQWYVNLVNNDFLNRTTGNPGYAVFGRITEGLDVVDAIGRVATGSEGGFSDVPVNDVIITSVRRLSTTGE